MVNKTSTVISDKPGNVRRS